MMAIGWPFSAVDIFFFFFFFFPPINITTVLYCKVYSCMQRINGQCNRTLYNNNNNNNKYKYKNKQ